MVSLLAKTYFHRIFSRFISGILSSQIVLNRITLRAFASGLYVSTEKTIFARNRRRQGQKHIYNVISRSVVLYHYLSVWLFVHVRFYHVLVTVVIEHSSAAVRSSTSIVSTDHRDAKDGHF